LIQLNTSQFRLLRIRLLGYGPSSLLTIVTFCCPVAARASVANCPGSYTSASMFLRALILWCLPSAVSINTWPSELAPPVNHSALVTKSSKDISGPDETSSPETPQPTSPTYCRSNRAAHLLVPACAPLQRHQSPGKVGYGNHPVWSTPHTMSSLGPNPTLLPRSCTFLVMRRK